MQQQPDGRQCSAQLSRRRHLRYILLAAGLIGALGLIVGLSVGLRSSGGEKNGGKGTSGDANDAGAAATSPNQVELPLF